MEVLLVPADADQPEGPEVVRKTATAPGERARLLREAEVLQAAGERGVPGVAAMVGRPSADAAEPCLITAAVAGPSLAVAAPMPVTEVAGVAAEVARLLAGLHDAGLVHGAVEPSHVVLDGAGGAILVGLGNGGPVGAAALDPADGALDPADDVASWGLLVAHLLDWSATTDDEPLVALRRALVSRRARRHRSRRPPPGRGDEDERRVLAALADQAQDPDPARRPSARSLAAAVTHRIPAARIPGAVAIVAPQTAGRAGLLDRLAAHVASGDVASRSEGPPPGLTDDRSDGPAPPRRRSTPGTSRAGRARKQLETFASGAGLAGSAPEVPEGASPHGAEAVGTGRPWGAMASPLSKPLAPGRLTRRGGSWTRRRRGAPVAAIALAVLAVPVAVSLLAPGRTRSANGVIPARSACPPAPPPAADVDGDGCEEPVRWVDGVLHAGSARFALGAPGDAWAVGDWDCDGRRTPALLHAGALSVFDAWPHHGAELRGRTVARAAGADGLTVVAGRNGCDQPALARPGAHPLVVDAGRAP